MLNASRVTCSARGAAPSLRSLRIVAAQRRAVFQLVEVDGSKGAGFTEMQAMGRILDTG